MKYILAVSIIANLVLFLKVMIMRKSVRELRTDFSAIKSLDSNTMLGVAGRDKEICALASELNDTLATLRDAYHKYRMGDAQVKTAITNIAHDLRTPLTAICGYLELSEKKEMSSELRQNLNIIGERASYMKKLTEELFEYSVITGGEVKEEKAPVNVGKVLEDCVMNYYPSLVERGIVPEVSITEQKIIRELYPSYVERIFNNLISNALKYSDGDLSIILDDDGNAVFSNTAASLSGVETEKLFDRFFTVETARKNAGGLGLSIVRTFADRMDLPLGASYRDGKLFIKISF